MSFKKFYDRKVEEITNRQQSFEEAKMFGAYPVSSRQPASFHYWLTLLERFTPEASKAEVLFEAVRAAYQEVVAPIRENMEVEHKQKCDAVFDMLYRAYHYKCSNSRADVQSTGGYFVTDDAKAVAEQFLSEFDSGSLSYSELIEKYKDTVLVPTETAEDYQ